jgi:(1->4)-alpha-D-glucan 1-alpha-D-glucosylmutase
VAGALARRPDLDEELIEFLGRLLVLDYPGAPEAEFATRFAQLSAPVMAKGVEDTAFYRYFPLASLNEVGGSPDLFGRSVAAFHADMSEAMRWWPEAMLTLSTHDTKRSADVRARIGLLAELPAPWQEAADRWAAHNARHKRDGQPDHAAEYLLYQHLVGAWPIDADRASAFMAKASKEAKLETSWTEPDDQYDEALSAFVTASLDDGEFRHDLEAFLGRYRLVERGRVTSLAQSALLLTCPGVPDLYQGTETWDLSLVDPDNRRPVDYDARSTLLAKLGEHGPESALSLADAGGPKLWLIRRLLAHRRSNPGAFGPGSGYAPLPATGTHADHLAGFVRTPPGGTGGKVVVLVPRLVARLGEAENGTDWTGPHWDRGGWDETRVELPEGSWTSVLTGEQSPGGQAGVGDLLARFPVAVLSQDR